MDEKRITIISDEHINEDFVEEAFGDMEASITLISQPPRRLQLQAIIDEVDLLVVDNSKVTFDISELDEFVKEKQDIALCVLLDVSDIQERMISRHERSDFASIDATPAEIALRCKRLLWPASMSSDVIQMGSLTVNLATYQVKVGDTPIDLTYMEYELLSFLILHPGRTYSREMLLSQVWGFDYYGGSRTVDVHVRRLRAKLGPEVAQHIETIRGAGYLWNT